MAQFISQCPHCGTQFTMQSEWIGQNIQCTSCGNTFPVQPPAAQGQPYGYGAAAGMPTAQTAGKSTASLVIGIINFITWLLPIVGIPLGIVGLILGCKKKYTVGIVLNAITLAAAIVNSVIGAILGAQGKLF